MAVYDVVAHEMVHNVALENVLKEIFLTIHEFAYTFIQEVKEASVIVKVESNKKNYPIKILVDFNTEV